MRRNIDMTHGLVMSEAVMMGLGPYIGREYAHDLVYDICREALKQQRPLLDLLAEHPRDQRAPRPRRAGEAVRPGQLPGPVRRDGRPRARHAALNLPRGGALLRQHRERRAVDLGRQRLEVQHRGALLHRQHVPQLAGGGLGARVFTAQMETQSLSVAVTSPKTVKP